MERTSGIILPLFSLPSPYGVGTLGKAARDFVDFLADAKQSWWQVLPVGPTSYGDSPYQSPSAFAGNPYFVDLDLLVADGLLTKAEVEAPSWGANPSRVDYGLLYENRLDLLRLACERGWQRDLSEVQAFAQENADWLDDYALFMALKRHFSMAAWYTWPDEDIRLHRLDACARYGNELASDVRLFTYVQYLFFMQWESLRSYAHAHGIGIFGDMPIYVALDSADVWAHPENYQLDERNNPVKVAGVPPDYFSSDGQLWGNPLYDYDRMARNGYAWWQRRVQAVGRFYGMVRIDHFRGFAQYWAVPYGETTAKNGHWEPGPGIDFVRTITSWFKDTLFIAEDLGVITQDVGTMLKESGLPGMKVLEFAFDPKWDSEHLPHNHTENCVCYIGTHDNCTAKEWAEKDAPKRCLDFAKLYLNITEDEGIEWGLIRAGMGSVARLFVAQMQDYLGLGAEGRINRPGTVGGNWEWRMTEEQLKAAPVKRIREITKRYRR